VADRRGTETGHGTDVPGRDDLTVVTPSSDELLDAGRAALPAGDAGAAWQAFERALDVT